MSPWPPSPNPSSPTCSLIPYLMRGADDPIRQESTSSGLKNGRDPNRASVGGLEHSREKDSNRRSRCSDRRPREGHLPKPREQPKNMPHKSPGESGRPLSGKVDSFFAVPARPRSLHQ